MMKQVYTPWTTRPSLGDAVAVLDADKVCIIPLIKPELGEHIVKCVNAHDGLIEALCTIANRSMMDDGSDFILQICKQALKAAGETV